MSFSTRMLIGIFLIAAVPAALADEVDVNTLPLFDKDVITVRADWLVKDVKARTEVYRTETDKEIVLSNGLIARTFRVAPNGATVGFDNLMTGEALLRGVKPEARVTVNGTEPKVGGLAGQKNYAYLTPEWIDGLTNDPAALQFVDFAVSPTDAPFPWERVRYAEDRPWPPPGKRLTLRFQSPADAPAGVAVDVHYEMYDGIPLLAKWLTIQNAGSTDVVLDTFTSEVLAAVEMSSVVDGQPVEYATPNIQVVTDYMFGGDSEQRFGVAVHWVADPDYATQVNYARQSTVLLESRPPIGPGVTLKPGEDFETYRTYELVFDATDRERNGLATRRMFRTIAPWTTENPIMMHMRNAEPEAVRNGIDQCAAVGFEMIILSFGSGFDIENEDPAYLAQLKELADYAHSKGIEIGGYSLLASRSIGPETDVVNPETGKPGGFARFGNSPCLCSAWGQDYFRKLYAFYEKTGFEMLEHDGSYPGDVCASTSHPGHSGLDDSQYRQWKTITDFYNWCRGRGVFLNVPDEYFLNGSNKTGMGYRETNWSLPRAEQVIHARQNIYDGTWEKTPSMGWMFVPLTEYQGGGAAATIEPLAEHLDVYEAHMANLFGTGVQACYRGPRLYDTDETKATVKQVGRFLQAAPGHSRLRHHPRAPCRRPRYRLHDERQPPAPGTSPGHGLQPAPGTRETEAHASPVLHRPNRHRHRPRAGWSTKTHQLARDYSITVDVEMEPQSVTWFVIEE